MKKVLILIIVIVFVGALSVKFHLKTKIDNFLHPKHTVVQVVSKTITFPEGYTNTQIFSKIKIELSVTDKQIKQALNKGINLPSSANNNPEGYLFPDTYDYNSNTTVNNLLRRMVENTKQHLNNLNIPQSKWHNVIILASMVEKEAKQSADRPKVARVFLNRIANHMYLQSDATVSYGTNSFDSVWTTDAQRNDANAYNTYKHFGLPIGPICNPGNDSIQAAFKPANGSWLYFVVVNLNTGETEFNNTLSEHNASVAKLKKWVANNG
jgi:UPF0755 protein